MVSKKAGKQRTSQRDAPLHVKRKRMRARLISDDPDLRQVRSVTVRVGTKWKSPEATSATPTV